MKLSRGMILVALAAPLFLAAPSRADFSYTTTIAPVSQTFGTASTVQFGPVTSAPGLQGSQNVNLANVADLTTRADPGVPNPTPAQTDTGSVPYTITVNLTQVPGVNGDTAGTGALSVAGTLTFTRSDMGGEISTNSVTSGTTTATIGNETYTINPASVTYAAPTVNAPLNGTGQGNISAILLVSRASVPEPASVALMGLGGLGLLAAFRRKGRPAA
jgi:hypothetical protein